MAIVKYLQKNTDSMKKIISLLFTLIYLQGLNASPASSAPTSDYQDATCPELKKELTRIENRIDEIDKHRTISADEVATNVFLTGVGIATTILGGVRFFGSYSDEDGEISLLIEDAITIEQTAMDKECNQLIAEIEKEGKQRVERYKRKPSDSALIK